MILLVIEVLIPGDQNLEVRSLRGRDQLSVIQPIPAHTSRCRNRMSFQQTSQLHRKIVVQQHPQAIAFKPFVAANPSSRQTRVFFPRLLG
jgi:hypothetical protein